MLVHGVKGGLGPKLQGSHGTAQHPQHCQHHPQDADDAGEWGDHTIGGGGGGTWPRDWYIYIYIHVYPPATSSHPRFKGHCLDKSFHFVLFAVARGRGEQVEGVGFR